MRYALERGVNYFDTAEGYEDGRSEEAIGEALQGERDRVFLASKVKAGARTPRAEIMKRLEGSLRRLRTDHIDVYFNHAVNDVARLENGEWFEFADRAREQGKIRFTGMSGHGGKLVECLDYALDNDLVDVILCGYNFGQDPSFHQRFTARLDWVAVQPDLPRVLEKAHAKGVGVVAMKTLRGARLNDMRPYERGGATFAQAAFRWVLSNPNVDALVISMTSREKIDEFVGASGGPEPRGAALGLLEGYLLSSRDGYCNHGCDACEASCPQGVPISEVLRTRMYATDYGDRDYASREYAQLTVNAASCLVLRTPSVSGEVPAGARDSTAHPLGAAAPGADSGGNRPRPGSPSPVARRVAASRECRQNVRMANVETNLEEALGTARAWIREAEKVVALTGAGISTESGIPDFRGPQGVWTKNPEAEKMATLQHYMSDPEVRRRAWKNRLASAAWAAKPNAGHRALVELERCGKLATIITQNVDGLHQKAGTSPEIVVEIHGTLLEVMCMRCGERAPMERALERVRAGEEDPPCRSCGGILKSATISFGQNLVHEDLVRSQEAAETCDLMLAIGSSLSVYPIAGVVPIAKRAGARVVIVNAEPTAMDDAADLVIRGAIGELLPRLTAPD